MSHQIEYEDNPEIFLIELFPSNSKDELITRARFYIYRLWNARKNR